MASGPAVGNGLVTDLGPGGGGVGGAGRRCSLNSRLNKGRVPPGDSMAHEPDPTLSKLQVSNIALEHNPGYKLQPNLCAPQFTPP